MQISCAFNECLPVAMAFWTHVINASTVGNNYRNDLVFSGAIMALGFAALPLSKRRPDIWLVTLYCATAVLVPLYFIVKRPKRSTQFTKR